MEGNEGSKYMTIYIVACFALAMVALGVNDIRELFSNHLPNGLGDLREF